MRRLLRNYFTISLPAIICVVLFGVAVFFYILPHMEEAVLAQKHAMTKEFVHIATDLMRTYERQAKKGVLTTAEAKARVISRLSAMRYGPDGKDYFWITDRTPRMIMHPYRSDLVGKVLTDYQDRNGKRLFVEMVEKTKDPRGGYVKYLWQWKDNPARIGPKLSFVTAFEPWGWVVGTGVYLDDLEVELATMERGLIATGLTVLLVVTLMAVFLTLRTIRSEKSRDQAMEAVKESEEKFRGISSSTHDGIVMIDSRGKISFWNEAAAKIFGVPEEEALGVDFHHHLAPSEHLDDYAKGMREFRKTGAGPVIDRVLELTASRKNGRDVPIELSVSAMRLHDEWHAVGVVRDITKRRKMEHERERARALLLAAIEQSPLGIIIADAKSSKIIQANATAQAILGEGSELLKRQFYDDNSFQFKVFDTEGNQVGPDDYPMTQAMRCGLVVSDVRYLIERTDGGRSWVDINAAPVRNEHGEIVYGMAVLADVTRRIKNEEDRKALRKQVQRSQKLEALGTLAGGIAHDFNNILFSILGYAELAELNLGDQEKLKKYIQRINQGGLRAQDLVQQILAFSRKTEGNKHIVDVSLITKEVTKFLRASIPTTVEIKTYINSKDNDVYADPTHIHQIIVNLCTNAAHAMHGDIGTLTVTLDDAVIGDEVTHADIYLPPGDYVELKVNDTGHGISDEVLDKVFDPFFSTKRPGEGTGLGLAVVHGLVNEMGGRVTIDTKVGEGTTFRVLIPHADGKSAGPVEGPIESLPKGTGRILLVDDEEPVVRVSKEMLERLGYEVTFFTDSRRALEAFHKAPTDYDLVITDLSMPKMTGIDLAREMKSTLPDIPILLWTGFNDRLVNKDVKAYGVDSVMLKPPTIRDLAQTVEKLLGIQNA